MEEFQKYIEEDLPKIMPCSERAKSYADQIGKKTSSLFRGLYEWCVKLIGIWKGKIIFINFINIKFRYAKEIRA